ncbi:RNA polymerase sigma factor SigX [Planococcus massiliensis]|uniref:RNA polymerase sigma factor SigX n=1 Tax=Planococcus massiliensis TaxID=1499687 RepID=A0A098ELE8_9BACL|nr:RNA polymerase sigma factor [Planococcus massiliensis]CEG22637.1 RNA polymerase sigma factor SigX [Planococcus massiliensis]
MEEEIEQLYLDHSDRVYRYIFLLIRQKENAEDLTQETFYKAFKNLKSFNHQSSVSTWLLKIARNVTYDFLRRKKMIRFFSMDNEEDHASSLPVLEEMVAQKEQTSELYRAMKTLKKDYQEVLLLRKINECSIKETAYILGWTEAKVKTKTSRALESLKKELIGKDGGLHGSEQTTR